MALAVLLGVAGCSGDASDTDDARAADSTAASTEAPAGSDAAASGPTEPTGGPDTAAPVASRTATVEAGSAGATGGGTATVRADLLPLQISDGALTVTLRLTVIDGGPARLARVLSDEDSATGDTSPFAPDGITVVDGTTKRVHLTASDGDGLCFCSPRDMGDQPAGSTVAVSALFAAPPAGVPAVDVVVPTFGTFGDVPLA